MILIVRKRQRYFTSLVTFMQLLLESLVTMEKIMVLGKKIPNTMLLDKFKTCHGKTKLLQEIKVEANL